MKKVLLATSALSLMAGAAAADIGLSGTGRMGITGGAATATSTRMRINFNASGETDGGLTFGAWTRVNINNAATGPNFSGASFYISNGTATLTLGNTVGAVANTSGAWGGVSNVGFTGLGFAGFVTGFNNTTNSSTAAGPNVARLDFSLGNASVSVSGGNGNNTEVAASFALGGATVGLGYDSGAAAAGGTTLTVGTALGGANVHLAYGMYGGTNNYVLSGSTAAGGGTVKAYFGSIGGGNNYGIGYDYGLGGGATVKVGYAKAGAAAATWDAGINFSF